MYRGGAEQKIRQYLVDNNYVDVVIQLPPDLFFGTNIGTCIIVLKKNKNDNNILFVDASKEFIRNSTKNKLSDENINNIIKIIENRTNVEYKSILVDYSQIKENEYNISVNTYLKAETEEKSVDIKELNKEIKEIVKREEILRVKIDDIVARLEADFDE